MKRIIVLFLLCAIAASACGAEATSESSTYSAETFEEEVVEEAAPEEEAVEEEFAAPEFMVEEPIAGMLPYEELLIPAYFLETQCRPPVIDDSVVTECSELLSASEWVEDEADSPVVLLIIDDFGSQPIWQLPGEVVLESAPNFKLFTAPPSGADNCLMRPNGQGSYASRGTADQPVPVAHGDLVFSKIDRLLWEWGMPQTAYEEQNNCWRRKVGLYESEDYGKILVVGVDTQNYNTQAVSNNIEAAIYEFGSFPILVGDYELPPSNRFVINMSFAILPCIAFNQEFTTAESVEYLREEIQSLPVEVYDPGFEMLLQSVDGGIEEMEALEAEAGLPPGDLQIAELGSFESNQLLSATDILGAHPRFFEFYDPSLINASHDEIANYISGLMNEYFVDDALVQHLNCYANREKYPRTVISVASAGNFNSYPYPFAPALLDSVVSVSADYSELPEFCQYAAETAGSNAGEITAEGWVESDDGECYLGSSFAAPWFSTVMAWLLMDYGTDLCAVSPDIYPPYGYADEFGSWDNLSFQDVLDMYCEGSP